ncbi:MAG TPA: cytochrome c peroxidase [Candidatus Krumholzibacteria bacterium]|nr:cytochrome c peroxidase [Candidatus Krumholzibacteria bacterium]HPD70819.1 cytochrome c peroxidase [Candidatus Krumholzibacteria bacterium]HRY39481.1 cytochrome c peroxidase [Candidatus Krumholzibacteria bacterium]
MRPARSFLWVAPAIAAMAGIAAGQAAAAEIGAAGAGAAGADPLRDERAVTRIVAGALGLPAMAQPPGGPPAAGLVALGRRLFFDRRLSPSGTMSCGMCHIPEQGFTSQELATPVGSHGRSLRRNAPTLLNVAWVTPLFHDGRAASLEGQALSPLLAPDEMANPSADALVARLAADPDMRQAFVESGSEIAIDAVVNALAAWQRTLVAGGSRFDQWRFAGDENALTDEERHGFALFTGAANCAACHTVAPDHALFTDLMFHDTGIGVRADLAAASGLQVPVEIAPGRTVLVDRALVESVAEPRASDLGRFEVTGDPADRHRYRTPSLRNVALTAPYMHDGSLATLGEVVRFYASGGVPHAGLDPRIRPLDLAESDVLALVAFLESLTSPDVAALVRDARSVPVGNAGP